jgi:hypothetical protein
MRRLLGPGAVRTRGLALASALFALSASCGDDDGDEHSTDKPDASDGKADASMSKTVSYSKDVKPIFAAYCTTCHFTGSIVDVDLENPFDPKLGIIDRVNGWATQHASPYAVIVKPGAPDDSFLIYKVSADPDPATFDVTNNGSPMPLQIPRATSDELTNIKQWISDGAKNDAFFTDKVAPFFGTQVTQTSRSGKCTFCHYPMSPTGLNVLDVFNTETGLVGAKSALSKKKRVEPGSPDSSFLVEKLESEMPSAGSQMPLHNPRLTTKQVDTLRTWIELGAKDD